MLGIESAGIRKGKAGGREMEGGQEGYETRRVTERGGVRWGWRRRKSARKGRGWGLRKK